MLIECRQKSVILGTVSIKQEILPIGRLPRVFKPDTNDLHRLAAVMAADVVSYRLMERDEAGTGD